MSNLYIYQGFEDDHEFLRLWDAYASRDCNVLTLARSGIKAVQPGDRVLIFDRTNKKLAIAAEVVGESEKGGEDDWPYLSPLSKFRVLSKGISVESLKKRFPKWGWPTYPRGKAKVPEKIAAKLWDMAQS